MAGYPSNLSKSHNALIAESRGSYPMSQAKRLVSAQAGITQKLAALIMEELHTGEWHHSSKYYNCVNYYSVKGAMLAINTARELKKDILEFARFCGEYGLIASDGEVNRIGAKTLIESIEMQGLQSDLGKVMDKGA